MFFEFFYLKIYLIPPLPMLFISILGVHKAAHLLSVLQQTEGGYDGVEEGWGGGSTRRCSAGSFRLPKLLRAHKTQP